MAVAEVLGHLVTILHGEVSCPTCPTFADTAQRFYQSPPSYIHDAANWALEAMIKDLRTGHMIEYDSIPDRKPQR